MNTKHNMVGEEVWLDLDSLIELAASAARNALIVAGYHLGLANNALYTGDNNTDEGKYHINFSRSDEANQYARAAKDYADAVTAYLYLVEAKSREVVKIER